MVGVLGFVKFVFVYFYVFYYFWYVVDLLVGILREGDKNGNVERCCFLKDIVY